MIRTLRGTILLRGKDHLVVETGGIGIKVFITESTALESNPGEDVMLHTYLQVRENAFTLYGFVEEDELTVFELLLGVSGVGPKVAQATLAVLNPDALRLAVVNEEPGMIARVPGVGKRTAEKIVLELRDKIKQSVGVQAVAHTDDVDSEVIEALIALGYSVVEAQRAVQKLSKEAQGVEERLRLALSQFT